MTYQKQQHDLYLCNFCLSEQFHSFYAIKQIIIIIIIITLKINTIRLR